MINQEIKELIVKSLKLEDIKPSDIKDDEPIFSDGLGLDSIDALELALAIQKYFNINMDSQKHDLKKVFYSVNTLAEFIEGEKNAK